MNEQQTGREKMTDNIEQYKNCLDGLTKDMPEEFFKLAQVFELSVFEPIHMEGKKDFSGAINFRATGYPTGISDE